MGDSDNGTPKTDLIICHIAENGPKTEYNLYKELPKLSHGTIHYVLNKLSEAGFIETKPSKGKEKRPQKLYQLTFMGATSYLSWFLPTNFSKYTQKELDEFDEHFVKEIHHKIVKFLNEQGPLLKYAPFQEINWLVEHYPEITREFLVIADLIARHPPRPYKSPLTVVLIALIKNRSNGVERSSIEEGAEFSKAENEAYRGEFTDLFFQLMFFKKRKCGTGNRDLRLLAEEVLDFKKMDARKAESIVLLFSKQQNSK
jgi:DNA-binding PadR family transcriptional regulator